MFVLLNVCIFSQSRPDGNIQIWPNPFIDHINIKIENYLDNRDLVVYDILGNNVETFEIVTDGFSLKQFQLTLDLPNGVYIVVYGDIVTKIICQK